MYGVYCYYRRPNVRKDLFTKIYDMKVIELTSLKMVIIITIIITIKYQIELCITQTYIFLQSFSKNRAEEIGQ